ncbi:MAG: hypothetical protein RIE86_09300 [Imperialibacter sp.]|uniref:hypothetical protein n=1 Tax=Imperialibacter sp. TaxID=2038411 RepID=UPI0032EB429B
MDKLKIYVASSWKNDFQPEVVKCLRLLGHQVYDFKNPGPNDHGFHWSEIEPTYKWWSADEFIEALEHPIAEEGFAKDFGAMQWADVCVLVLPCNRSAHTEAGWFAGKGKPVFALLEQKPEPELMYKVFDACFHKLEDLSKHLLRLEALNG